MSAPTSELHRSGMPGRPIPTIADFRKRFSFVGWITAILLLALLALLLVNNSLAAGSFSQSRLKAERTALFEREQALQQEVLALSSPTRLRSEAAKLGLVAAATTVYVDLAAGEILGQPRAAGTATLADAPAEGQTAPVPGTDPAAPPVPGEEPLPQGETLPGGEPNLSPTEGDEAAPVEGDGASVSENSAWDRATITGGHE